MTPTDIFPLWMVVLIYGLFGAFVNRYVRGMGADGVFGIKRGADAITAGLWMVAAGFFLGLPAAFYFALAYWRGAVGSWGEEIGAAQGDASQVGKGGQKWLYPSLRRFENRPRLWGFLALSARGVEWMIYPCFVLQSVLPLAIGACMGAAYATAIAGRRTIVSKIDETAEWESGELIFGAFMGGGFALIFAMRGG